MGVAHSRLALQICETVSGKRDGENRFGLLVVMQDTHIQGLSQVLVVALTVYRLRCVERLLQTCCNAVTSMAERFTVHA